MANNNLPIDAAQARINGRSFLGKNPGPHVSPITGTVLGRPSSEVRELSKVAYADRIPILEQIADDKSNAASIRIQAIATLGKFGLGDKIDIKFTNDQVLRLIAIATAPFIEESRFDEWTEACINILRDQ